MTKLLLSVIFCLELLVSPVFGADFNFELNLSSTDNFVTISVQNKSRIRAVINDIDLELNGKKYVLLQEDVTIPPGSSIRYETSVNIPSLPGSYPITATVKYYNDKNILTLRDVGLFYYRNPALLTESIKLDDITLSRTGEIVVRSSTPGIWRLVLPDEIQILSEQIFTDHKVFKIGSSIDGFNNVYSYFAVAEDEKAGFHRTAVIRGVIKLLSPASLQSAKGKVSSKLLILLLIAFFIACYAANGSDFNSIKWLAALHKYSSRMFLLTLSYLMLKNAGMFIGTIIKYIDFARYKYVADIMINHFNGPNYQFFFMYFIDCYYLLCLLLLYAYLYYRESETQLQEDKYSSLMMSIFSIGGIFRRKKLYLNYQSKLGLLTFCVKIFFVPLLVSWVINNTFHQIDISKSFKFDLATVNAYLVALFIYIDTIVFCFGYLFEFAFLKNKIKSVEPTLLGWLVCLWCYPPFNQFSYKIFDHNLIDIGHDYPAGLLSVMTCLITILWGIFAWASITLGYKASNLTNRGIVNAGPYQYVRHPAYSAKLLVFYIQGVFLGQYYMGLLLGFTIIYIFRALTEERHLSRDPDYIEYKDKVRWRFIPSLI